MRSKPRKGYPRGFTLVELALTVGITFILVAISITAYFQVARNMRTSGDGRNLASEVSLAKMRAPAYFTQARVYADFTAETYHIEVWVRSAIGSCPANTWCPETQNGTQNLSQGVSFGYGTLSTPPSNTQGTLGQAPACLDNSGNAISSTACIVFNSRGIPVDATGAPTANDALYVSDGQQTYGVTVSSTGLIQSWQTAASSASWRKR